jgi:hypothetical protein
MSHDRIIAAGDIVKLKGSDRPMVVESFKEPFPIPGQPGHSSERLVKCIWHDEAGAVVEHMFATHVLELIDADGDRDTPPFRPGDPAYRQGGQAFEPGRGPNFDGAGRGPLGEPSRRVGPGLTADVSPAKEPATVPPAPNVRTPNANAKNEGDNVQT